jgi:hypothetical protein
VNGVRSAENGAGRQVRFGRRAGKAADSSQPEDQAARLQEGTAVGFREGRAQRQEDKQHVGGEREIPNRTDGREGGGAAAGKSSQDVPSASANVIAPLDAGDTGIAPDAADATASTETESLLTDAKESVEAAAVRRAQEEHARSG